MTSEAVLQPMMFNTMFQPENGLYGFDSANTHGMPAEYMDFEHDIGVSHLPSKVAWDTASAVSCGHSTLVNEYANLPHQTGLIAEDGIHIGYEAERMNTCSNEEIDCDYEIEREEPPMLPRSSHQTTLLVHFPTKSQAVAKRPASTARKQTTCPLCSKPMLQRVLLRHIRTVHHTQQLNPPMALHRCPQCHETFARKDNLVRHQAEQHGDKSGTVECPGCKAQVRLRALDSHLKSRKCQEAELEMDLALLRSHRQSWIASLDDPGRFDESTAVDPLFVAIVYNAECAYFERGTLANPPLKTRGLALRATFRALNDPTEAESGPLAFALLWLAVGDTDVFANEEGFECPREFYVAFRALFALEQRFDRYLINGNLLRRGAIGHAMLEYVDFKDPEGMAQDIDEFNDEYRREILEDLQKLTDWTIWA